ncbi:MAG: DUF4364 family protein [Lachnospiraceae bacterium]|nr:DUF4364 family protein [Lachnospiraceae bacterium]
MAEKPLTTYKLIILQLLESSTVPLTNTQFTSFFMDTNYGGYFVMQEAISDLSDDGLINPESQSNDTRYTITPSGKAVLLNLAELLNSGIKSDIENYLNQNNIEIIHKAERTADYRPADGGGFTVDMRVYDGLKSKLEIKLSVASEAIAKVLCENWERQSENVYDSIIEILS